MITEHTFILEAKDDAIFFNNEGIGFYTLLYETALLQKLVEEIDSFSPVNQCAILMAVQNQPEIIASTMYPLFENSSSLSVWQKLTEHYAI